MDVQLLWFFLMIVESGGFSVVQGMFGMVLLMISMYMVKFEMWFGFWLCDCGKSGFWLMLKGECVLQLMCCFLYVMDVFMCDMQYVLGMLFGELCIGLFEWFLLDVVELIVVVVGCFCECVLDVLIEMIVVLFDELECWLLKGEL